MVRSIGTTNRTSVPSGSVAVRGWLHNNVFSICEMFCARLVCEWPLIARADTQTLAVINVCLFSHILCGRLSIFYAGCDPALFFSVPVFLVSCVRHLCCRSFRPLVSCAREFCEREDYRFRRQRYYKKEERFSVPFLSFLFLSDFFIFFRLVWFSRCRCSISRKGI